MKSKRPLLYLAAVIVITFVVLAIEKPEKPRFIDSSDEYFVPNFDTAKIARVEVENDGIASELKVEDGKWLVRSTAGSSDDQWHDADSTRIKSSLGYFGGLEQGVVVSSNPDKQSLYQVDAGGLKVRAFDAANNLIFDIVIGKNGPDFGSSYIRRFAEPKVYLVKRSITGVFSPKADDWRDKNIEPVDSK